MSEKPTHIGLTQSEIKTLVALIDQERKKPEDQRIGTADLGYLRVCLRSSATKESAK